MTTARVAGTGLAFALLVSVLVWPFRSHDLFSWDSANYAFAMSRIDIAVHRPHPPGYLGYVFAGRFLRAATADPNAALILWNIAALAGAAVLTAMLGDSMGLSPLVAWAAAILVVASPLVWFYTSIAEIYVSELFWAAAIAYTAHAALRGSSRALYWCAAALAGAALFKPSTTALMLPLAGYAWYRAPTPARTRATLLFAVAIAADAIAFLTVAPDLPTLVWQQFVAATVSSRLVGSTSERLALIVAFNRNLRDSFTASVSALGIVNAAGLVAWLIVGRQLPPLSDRRFVALWALPWCAVFLLILIAKPGYVLPLMPLAAVVLAAFYARRGPALLAAAIGAQAVANVLYVGCVTPATDLSGVPYRDKTVRQRMASDLAALTFPTRATLRASDRHIEELKSVASTCAPADWILVTGGGTVDWRRAMFYVPTGRAVYVVDRRPTFIGTNGDFVPVPDSGTSISSRCGLLWLLGERPPVELGAGARAVADLGWTLPAGSGSVTRDAISWTAR